MAAVPRLALWAQLSIGLAAAVVLAVPVHLGGGAERRRPSPRRSPTRSATVAVTSDHVAGAPAGDQVAVVRVIDGDTIVVSGDVHVRLIGVDTPETNAGVDVLRARGDPVHERALPPGTTVRLVYDVERLDRYGRTLAYVYKLSDGVFVNLAVARNGFAVQLTVPPNVAHAEEFRAAVAEARSADLGLWRACRTTTTVPGP